MAVVNNYYPNMIGFYCGMAGCWSQSAISSLHRPFSSVESEPKHMTCPSKLQKWLWEADNPRAGRFCSGEMQLWAMFMFFSRKCFVGASSHRERGQDSDSSVSRVRGGKDVYELPNCLRPKKYFMQKTSSSPSHNFWELLLCQVLAGNAVPLWTLPSILMPCLLGS